MVIKIIFLQIIPSSEFEKNKIMKMLGNADHQANGCKMSPQPQMNVSGIVSTKYYSLTKQFEEYFFHFHPSS